VVATIILPLVDKEDSSEALVGFSLGNYLLQ